MKRILKTYLSWILLLCLAVELVPLNLMHSHTDHHETEVEHHIVSSFHDADTHSGEYAADAHDDSSEEECVICEIQQSLNNQAYTLSSRTVTFDAVNQSSVVVNRELCVDDYLLENISGRAPPVA